VSKLTLKSNREEAGEQLEFEMEGLFIGVFLNAVLNNCCNTYLHWIEFYFVKIKIFK
jgi:hypothetical protein